MGEAPEKIRIEGDGQYAIRDYRAESAAVPSTAGWPLECEGSGVHPGQAQQLRDYYDRHGCPTEVTSRGNPVYRNAAHRKKALKCRAMHDRNSFS